MSPPMRPRERPASARSAATPSATAGALQPAADTFAERGLAATMDDIADRAGVGVGTVYRYFPTSSCSSRRSSRTASRDRR
jgi:AcrR family transcriptional regulator